MKRKQRSGIFVAEMKQNDIMGMADSVLGAARWAGKVGIATAMLALVGVLAGPDAPIGNARDHAALPQRMAGS